VGIVGESKKKKRPNPGDLVAVNSANDFINVYMADPNFSFAKISFMALNGEMGVVIDHASDESGSILFHYVKVLFQRGAVGIAHSGLLRVLEIDEDDAEESCVAAV
jgi:hypothetical protein